MINYIPFYFFIICCRINVVRNNKDVMFTTPNPSKEGWACFFIVLNLMWFLFCFFFRMVRLEGTAVEEEMGEFIILTFRITYHNYFNYPFCV